MPTGKHVLLLVAGLVLASVAAGRAQTNRHTREVGDWTIASQRDAMTDRVTTVAILMDQEAGASLGEETHLAFGCYSTGLAPNVTVMMGSQLAMKMISMSDEHPKVQLRFDSDPPLPKWQWDRVEGEPGDVWLMGTPRVERVFRRAMGARRIAVRVWSPSGEVVTTAIFKSWGGDRALHRLPCVPDSWTPTTASKKAAPGRRP